jgi:VanZ family protein
MTQLFVPGRFCSSFDLLDNMLGAVVGVVVGFIFEEMATPVRLFGPGMQDPSGVAVLYCWVASLAYPFLPETSLRIWLHKASAFVHGPILTPVRLVSAAATWYAAFWLLRSANLRRPGVWWVASTLLIPAQILIVSRRPAPVELVGAIAGMLALVCAFAFRSLRTGAVAFLAVLLVRGLTPFHFTPAAHPFLWTPFTGYLGMNWQPGILIFLEKAFYYSAAIWLLKHSGVRWLSAIGMVAAVLAVIEIAQTHIPGRTPEITDPLLAVLAGLGLMVCAKKRTVGYHANS